VICFEGTTPDVEIAVAPNELLGAVYCKLCKHSVFQPFLSGLNLDELNFCVIIDPTKAAALPSNVLVWPRHLTLPELGATGKTSMIIIRRKVACAMVSVNESVDGFFVDVEPSMCLREFIQKLLLHPVLGQTAKFHGGPTRLCTRHG
jgi:hypothetical protein